MRYDHITIPGWERADEDPDEDGYTINFEFVQAKDTVLFLDLTINSDSWMIGITDLPGNYIAYVELTKPSFTEAQMLEIAGRVAGIVVSSL